jgi:hypothetical protein
MEFNENCVRCHGKDGTGRGELGAPLAVPPQDLTRSAQRNGSVFPFWPVFEVIAGEKPIPGHDTLDMPLCAHARTGRPARVSTRTSACWRLRTTSKACKRNDGPVRGGNSRLGARHIVTTGATSASSASSGVEHLYFSLPLSVSSSWEPASALFKAILRSRNPCCSKGGVRHGVGGTQARSGPPCVGGASQRSRDPHHGSG